MRISKGRGLLLSLVPLCLAGCREDVKPPRVEVHKVTVTAVRRKDVVLTQEYVCKIESTHHAEILAPEEGALATILVEAGQAVKRDDLLFRVAPPADREKPDVAIPEDKVASIKAPFDGKVGRLRREPGSPVRKFEALTTLSDDRAMAAKFHVSERRYLELMGEKGQDWRGLDVRLVLADRRIYPEPGKLIGPEAQISSQTGDIAFRAEFPNPDGLLRHGQSGTLRLDRSVKDVLVIPQRATFESLDKRYVFVVDKDRVARRREVVVKNELKDDLVIEEGVEAGDLIVLESAWQIYDGHKLEFEFVPAPEDLGAKMHVRAE